MDITKRISRVFQSSEEIFFDDSSKIIFMSDCHRGDGSWADDFSRNQNLYYAALSHYYKKGYTYIELGDGDELWENRNITNIVHLYMDIFKLLSKFFKKNRLYLIYGNHDMEKKDPKFVENNLYYYFDERNNKYISLFPNIKIHEGLVLKHRISKNKILLMHGHQVDLLNNDMWKLARFLVRYLWKPLSSFGISDPTRTAQNYKNKDTVAKRLVEWVIKEKHMLITGHNHRPMFPEVGEPPYFNDGSCVHPRCITGIEITEGNIMLVKWCTKTREDGSLFIGKDILAGPRKVADYFKVKKLTKLSLNFVDYLADEKQSE